MSMEPVDVYLMYCALKAHFGKGKYDYHKYGEKLRLVEIASIEGRIGISLLKLQRDSLQKKK